MVRDDMRNFNSRTELALRCATKLDTTSGGGLCAIKGGVAVSTVS